ncbi:ABC transporter permease [candidate division KSB1 bacterium]|nr:ABC transporter permease [candidate division KSB1 bacterium]
MFKNYLKIALRNIKKQMTFTMINIVGLGLSMAICLMIIIYIKDQKSSDHFHEKKDCIARVYTTDREIKYSEIKGWATTPGSLAPYLLDNCSVIEDAVRLRWMWGDVLYAGTAIPISGLYAEPSFFNIFSYELKNGDPASALDKPYSIILSEEVAYKFFGNNDPINKTLTFEKLGDFTVTGVLKKSDQKSQFRFEALASFATVSSLERSGIFDTDMNSWSSFNRYYTYVLLKQKTDLSLFEKQLPQITNSIFPEPTNARLGLKLQPLMEINLGMNLANKMPGTKHSFEIIFIPFLAILIIFLACFNYIILSIARSLKRTKEIGLRKVIGSKKIQIIKLFLSETFLITFLALIFACLLLLWLIPIFNDIDVIQDSRQQINLELMKDPGLYLIFISFAIIVSFLAGLYPALYLSSFQPINALQGNSKIKGLSHLLTRKILMGIQFGISLISIILIVYFFQLQTYWMKFNYGISTDNIVNVYLEDVNYQVFKNEMMTNHNIKSISFSNEILIFGGFGSINLRTQNMEKPISVNSYSIDPELINTFKIELRSGRNFSTEFSTDRKNAIIINEQAIQAFELGSPAESIGKTLLMEDNSEVMIIGVVKNFNYTFPDEPIRPLAFRYRPEDLRVANISYKQGTKDEIKAYLPIAWKKLDKLHSIRYEFFDDALEQSSSEISGTLNIFAWLCAFIILIALLGLLGMATYTTEMRIQEIGIRKVLGASVPDVTYLLSKDYIKLILFSAVFAIPSGYFLTDAIMQNFAFRPVLNLWVLPAALIFILVLALITIGSQTVKAAVANPIESIRYE